jgi:hypothetical protein
MPEPTSSPDATRAAGRRRAPAPGVPRWVRVFVIVLIVLIVLFVILHLTGNGFGQHMHMAALTQRIGPLCS